MNKPLPKQGRPAKDPSRHKRNRSISLTDAEYALLGKKAAAAGMGISEYVIAKCGLVLPPPAV